MVHDRPRVQEDIRDGGRERRAAAEAGVVFDHVALGSLAHVNHDPGSDD